MIPESLVNPFPKKCAVVAHRLSTFDNTILAQCILNANISHLILEEIKTEEMYAVFKSLSTLITAFIKLFLSLFLR